MESKKLEKPCENATFQALQGVMKPDEETGGVFPGEHIIHLTAKGIGEPNQLPADQRHKEDNAEQHKETEQEHTPDSGYILGQQINGGADCTNRQQQKRSQKDAGFVDGEFSHIHLSAPPIHI